MCIMILYMLNVSMKEMLLNFNELFIAMLPKDKDTRHDLLARLWPSLFSPLSTLCFNLMFVSTRSCFTEFGYLTMFFFVTPLPRSSLVLEDVEKQSTCELEADAVAADILNRLEIESKQHNKPWAGNTFTGF